VFILQEFDDAGLQLWSLPQLRLTAVTVKMEQLEGVEGEDANDLVSHMVYIANFMNLWLGSKNGEKKEEDHPVWSSSAEWIDSGEFEEFRENASARGVDS